MEVHHHPHVEKKGFKEYFLEFLMIFLAVTLGFFAENIRENIINHSKEREYMHLLIEDLQADTTLMQNAIKKNTDIHRNDSAFLNNMGKALKDSFAFKNMLALYPKTESFYTAFYDSKTFDELKSTGDIRLIESKEVFKALSNYYQEIDRLKILRDEIQTGLEFSYQNADRAIDLYSLENNYPSWQEAYKDRSKLITNDAGTFKTYVNALNGVSIGYNDYDNALTLQAAKAVKLIELIREEYHFKN